MEAGEVNRIRRKRVGGGGNDEEANLAEIQLYVRKMKGFVFQDDKNDIRRMNEMESIPKNGCRRAENS